MTHLGLFEGFGASSLAAKWMNWQTIAWCEINPFCQRILKYYFPDAIPHGDITKTDFTKYADTVDILTGGFPCQPYSLAGKRKGKQDDRHLWPEMLRTIREVRPRWVVGENVRGLVNWAGGVVFHEVQSDLEAEGYQVLPFLLPASSVNAPHRRDRIWFVAHASMFRCRGDIYKGEGIQLQEQALGKIRSSINKNGFNTNTDSTPAKYKIQTGRNLLAGLGEQWRNFPAQSPVCGGNDGLPSELDGITFSKWRKESIKGYGNAIVPQVIVQIYKSIEQYEKIIAA